MTGWQTECCSVHEASRCFNSLTRHNLERNWGWVGVHVQVQRFNDGALAQTVFIEHLPFLWLEQVIQFIDLADNQTYGCDSAVGTISHNIKTTCLISCGPVSAACSDLVEGYAPQDL